MPTPFVGQLMLVGFNFAPADWHICDGSLLPISQYEVLFTLLGTTYGGDGVNTFGIPDLRGRVPMHQGAGHVMGEVAGAESVVLGQTQIPNHTHGLNVSTTSASTPNAGGGTLAAAPAGTSVFHAGAPGAGAMNAASISTVGGSQSHPNMQPYLVMNWIISLFGVYPSQS